MADKAIAVGMNSMVDNYIIRDRQDSKLTTDRDDSDSNGSDATTRLHKKIRSLNVKTLLIFAISLSLLSCQSDTPQVSLSNRVDNLEERVGEQEKKIATLKKQIAANEKRIAANEKRIGAIKNRITAIERKQSISKAYRIAMIYGLDKNGFDGEGWATEVDAFFEGLTEEHRKQFVKVPMEDFADLMHTYGLTFPWER